MSEALQVQLRKGVLELPEVRFPPGEGSPAPPPPGIDRSADAGLTERAL